MSASMPMLVCSLVTLATTVVQDSATPALDMLGDEIVALGDVDQDGAGDFLVTAPLASHWLWVISGVDGSVIHHLTGDPGNKRGSAGAAGDWNGDGIPDFAAVVHNSLRVYSGRDASQLFALGDTIDGHVLGPRFAHLDDVDGDGVGDFVMTVRGMVERGGPHYALLVSGGKRSVLFVLEGLDGSAWFARAVANAGDVNGDGTTDVIVGGGRDAEGRDYARVFSGRDGAVLHTLRVGEVAGLAADLDGDGHAEVLAASPSKPPEWRPVTVSAYSGRSGDVLFELTSPVQGFGSALANAGDVNGDGVGDVLVGARGGLDRGFVRLYSGDDGALLRQWAAAEADWYSDWALSGIGDVDGDAIPDVAIGVTYSGMPDKPGSVRVYSGKDGRELYRLDQKMLIAYLK
ncbi:MAG: hypothetical protein E2O39_16165 [Planctomycetota bacterium]|nr:MAG: hypothetical protein E2O39_16165 [Planctomycetota bacterium]